MPVAPHRTVGEASSVQPSIEKGTDRIEKPLLISAIHHLQFGPGKQCAIPRRWVRSLRYAITSCGLRNVAGTGSVHSVAGRS